MAAPVFEKKFVQDIRQPVRVRRCGDLMFTGDANADTIYVEVYNDGSPYNITGTVTLNCIRADCATVAVTGSISGNVAQATLAQACCAISGPLAVVMKITSGDVTSTILKAVYTVDVGVTGTTVDPGTIVNNVNTLIAAINAAVASVPSDYSDLLAAIAPYYSDLTFPVKAGQRCWYDGDYYRAKVDIATSETWTAAHWETAVLSNDVAELQSDKLDAPSTAGTAGQALVTDGNGNVSWADVEIEVDATLSQSGEAADAKATGDEITELKSEIDDIYDANIQVIRKYSTIAEENNYRLNESDGYKTENSGYKLVKYAVEAGKTVKIISDDRFQFQNSATVLISGTDVRIGDTYGAGTFHMKVPTGATYLIVSTPQTSGHAVYDYDASKTYIDKTRYRISRADDLLTIHAYLDGNGTWVVQTAENELYCTDFIPVSSGEKIRYAGKAYSSRTIFGFYTSADPTANASSTVAGGGNTTLKEGEFTAPSNGYIRFATNMAGGGDYLIFDSRVSDVDAKKYEKPSSGIPSMDLASAVQTSLGKADTAYQKPSGGIPATDLASGVIPTVHNVPSGGTSGQVLAKASGTDYDLEWTDQTGGSGSDETILGISDGILYELKTDRSETYEKNIPANALPWDAKLISIKGKSYLDGNSEAVVLAPSSITSFDANGDQVDSVSVSSVVSSVFDGKMASVNGIADEINFVSQKAYKRCAVKKFSECSWIAVTQGTLNFFRASSSGRRKNTNGWMEGYTESTVNYTSASFPDDSYYFPDNSGYIYVRDDSYQTVDEFLQAKGNTLIVTVLETYTETSVSLDDSIKIAPGGKIRFANTDSLTVQNEIQYFIPKTHEVASLIVPGDCLTIRNGLPTCYTEAPENPDDFEDDSYIDVKIESIPDGKHLIFFTDTHWNWGNNAQHSPALIQYVRKRTEIRNVLFGGDFINQATDKYLARQVLGDFSYKCLSAFEDGFLPVLGNHDTNLPGVTSAEQAATVYLPYWVLQKVMFGSLPKTAHTQYETDAGKMSGLTLTDNQEADLTGYMKTQYYYDDEAQKIRFIIVNSEFPKYGDLVDVFGNNDCRLSLDWVYSVLHSTPEGYDVALCIHQMGLAYNEGVFEYGSGSYYAYPSLLMGLKTKSVKELNFAASSNENLTAWWPHTKFAYDFTTCNNVGKVIIISGHSHCDCLSVITQDTTRAYRVNIAVYDGSSTLDQATATALNGCPIPVIYTTTDAFGRYGDAPDDHETPMTEDTITEQAFDVITLRSGEIRTTRFGAGSDRVLYITA